MNPPARNRRSDTRICRSQCAPSSSRRPAFVTEAAALSGPRAPSDSADSARQSSGADATSPVRAQAASGRRGHDWTFSGHVDYVTGAHGEWVRRELAGVLCGLLAWAASEVSRPSALIADGGQNGAHR
ncbi:hypothetical protein GCM10010174_88980 [Kutzneria viridogrisea]